MSLQEQLSEIIGESGMLVHGILCFEYMDGEGQRRWAYITVENPDVVQTIGLLETVKFNIGGTMLGHL